MTELTRKTISCTLIAFIAGFAMLAVEIAGIRLIAGTLGNSIFTWSALIAAILLSMSLGSMAGGTLIDRSFHVKWLLFALIFAAAATAITPILAATASGGGDSSEEGSLFGCAIIFALPGFAFGAVPPLCVKLISAAGKGKSVGFSAGIVSMAGSLGSFVGALATPFWLIPNLSLNSIFFCLATVVILSALLLVKAGPISSQAALFVALAGLCLGSAAVKTRATVVRLPYLLDETTPYHRIRVRQQQADGRPARFLFLDTTLEGGIVPGEKTLPLEYQNTWQLAAKLGIPVKRALCIGAGAFGVPERISQAWPDAVIDVAEIDPQVIQAGRDFFDVGKFPQIHPVAIDGRLFLRRGADKYDLIFIDAYHGIRYIPPHLTTQEFFSLCRAHLSEDGMVMMNVISSVMGPGGKLFRAFGATVKSVFPDCGMIPLKPSSVNDIQNIVLICRATPWPREEESPILDLPSFTAAGNVMTDQKNPIEAILAQQLNEPE